MMEWFSSLDPRLQSAIVAAVIALSVTFLKDLIFKMIFDRRDAAKRQKEVFRLYAEPLGRALESLFWRLNEVINVEGRAHFLMQRDFNTSFENYKFQSTLYRLAAVLGWIRALRKEQSFIKHRKRAKQAKLSNEISQLEAALSDGPHVEDARLDRLLSLWEIKCDDALKPRLAVDLEALLKKFLSENDVETASDLPDDPSLELSTKCAELISTSVCVSTIPLKVLQETRHQAMRRLSIREAWLYRDWQTGIGDLMIKEIDSEGRRYDVVGFKEFESWLLSDDEEIKRWINRVERVFTDVDMEIDDSQDVRVRQIKSTFLAVASLIVALQNSDEGMFSSKTVETARINASN